MAAAAAQRLCAQQWCGKAIGGQGKAAYLCAALGGIGVLRHRPAGPATGAPLMVGVCERTDLCSTLKATSYLNATVA
jgi:hypothetical protein